MSGRILGLNKPWRRALRLVVGTAIVYSTLRGCEVVLGEQELAAGAYEGRPPAELVLETQGSLSAPSENWLVSELYKK